MTTVAAVPATGPQQDLLTQMVERAQLSSMDAEVLAQQCLAGTASADTEEEVLQWLALEYGLDFTKLENIEPERSLLARFSARILLKERAC